MYWKILIALFGKHLIVVVQFIDYLNLLEEPLVN